MSNVLTSSDVPKNPADRRAWVCYQLRLRGNSLRKIASQLGVSQQAMSHSLMLPSSRCEPAVAEALGLTVQQLFPERFDGNGYRLTHIRRHQPSTRPHGRNVEDGRAA